MTYLLMEERTSSASTTASSFDSVSCSEKKDASVVSAWGVRRELLATGVVLGRLRPGTAAAAAQVLATVRKVLAACQVLQLVAFSPRS